MEKPSRDHCSPPALGQARVRAGWTASLTRIRPLLAQTKYKALLCPNMASNDGLAYLTRDSMALQPHEAQVIVDYCKNLDDRIRMLPEYT